MVAAGGKLVEGAPLPARLIDRKRRSLTVGLVLVVSLVAFEALAVATVLPAAVKEIGGLSLYGWAFSAFLLASLITTVAAGEAADRTGPVIPFLVGLALFGGGLVVAGLAPAMLLFVAGRALQGAGAGAITTMAYVGISRGYPDALRARMFALLSSAWVVPGLVGPALAGALAERASWRLVFLGLLPLLVIAGALTLPALRRMGAVAADRGATSRLLPAVQLALGTGLLLGGLSVWTPLIALPLVAGGGVIALPALLRLMPPGTFRARPGIPAGLAVNALLNFGFFTTEVFLPLALTTLRDLATDVAGLALTAASLTWTAGSWVQARLDSRDGGAGRRGRVSAGFALVFVGVALTALALLSEGLPLALVWAGWSVAGGGMGLAYPTISLLVLNRAPAGEEGSISGSVRVAELLSVAVGAGVGGAVIAAIARAGGPEVVGIGIAFGMALTATTIGLAATRRL